MLGELVHQAVKRGRDREKENARSDRSPKKGSEPSKGRKGITITPSLNAPRTSSIKCVSALAKAI
ncbi:hypothetical protein CR513_56884, partial [Mucuna pruriens]